MQLINAYALFLPRKSLCQRGRMHLHDCQGSIQTFTNPSFNIFSLSSKHSTDPHTTSFQLIIQTFNRPSYDISSLSSRPSTDPHAMSSAYHPDLQQTLMQCLQLIIQAFNRPSYDVFSLSSTPSTDPHMMSSVYQRGHQRLQIR